MTKHDWQMPLSYEIAQAFGKHYVPAFEAELKTTGLEWSDVSATQAAEAVAPAPLTAARIHERIPYHALSEVESDLASAAERGALAGDGNGGYVPTELGHDVYQTGLRLVGQTADELAARVPGGTARLADLMGRVVAGCQASTIDKPSLTFSRSFDPGPGASPMLRVRRYNQDLILFRDDAHVAAWRPYTPSGIEWETFSHVWGENIWGDPAATTPALAEKLSFRGYTEADYAAALARLVDRGWLAQADGTYHVTDAGREVRQAAEDATDANFYGPWPLSDDEAAEMKGLMEELRDSLAG